MHENENKRRDKEIKRYLKNGRQLEEMNFDGSKNFNREDSLFTIKRR